MSEKKDIFVRARVNKKKYSFKLEDIYKHCHQWLLWKDYDVIEKKYKEKVLPEGKTIKIDWECTRDIDEYSRFLIKVQWQFFGISNVKVMREGREVSMQHGEMDTYISAYLVMDWQDKWEESAFFTFLKAFYEKYLYVGTIGRLKKELWREGWEFYNEMKAFMELYTYEITK